MASFARSGKDSVSVAGVAPLNSDATQLPAHSLVPLTVPTSLQPIGSFGFTCTSGLLPTLGGAACAYALVEKPTAAKMTSALIVVTPSPSAGWLRNRTKSLERGTIQNRSQSFDLALIGAKETVVHLGRKSRLFERRYLFEQLLYFAGFLIAEFSSSHSAASRHESSTGNAIWRPEWRN